MPLAHKTNIVVQTSVEFLFGFLAWVSIASLE